MNDPFEAPRDREARPDPDKLSDGHFEFDAYQNETIARTGVRARRSGVIIGLVGALLALGCVITLALSSKIPATMRTLVLGAVLGFAVPSAVAYLAAAKLYVDAGARLIAVTTTRGNDVELLMHALDKLASAFRIEVIATIVGLLVGFGAGIFATRFAQGGA